MYYYKKPSLKCGEQTKHGGDKDLSGKFFSKINQATCVLNAVFWFQMVNFFYKEIANLLVFFKDKDQSPHPGLIQQDLLICFLKVLSKEKSTRADNGTQLILGRSPFKL
jgi:hypothetical protein